MASQEDIARLEATLEDVERSLIQRIPLAAPQRQRVLSRLDWGLQILLAAGERRLGAKMFTDLFSYSAFTSRDEGRPLNLLEENRTFLQATFQKHGDVVLKPIGDGFLPYLRGFPYLARYRSGPRWSAIVSGLGLS